MASLGSLVVELAANTARLSSDLGAGINAITTFASRARTALGVIGVGATGGAFVQLARQAISLGDDLAKGAQRAGIAASTFSEIAAAAKQADVSLESLSAGLRNIQKSIADAQRGGKETGAAFRQLGLDVDVLANLKADAQLRRVADALNQVSNSTDRTALGSTILSKAYLDLVPLLDGGSASINQLVEAQKRLGNTFSDQQIANLSEADDAIKELKSSWQAFATTLTAAVGPKLSAILKFLTPTTDAVQQQIKAINQLIAERARLGLDTTDLFAQRSALQSQADNDRRSQFPRGHGGLTPEQQEQIEFIRKQKALSAEADAKYAKEFADQLKRAQAAHANDKLGELGPSFIDAQRNALAGQLNGKTSFISAGSIIDPKELEAVRSEFGDTTSYIEATASDIEGHFHDSFTAISEFAEQAAHNMQDALAQFLFDPFKDGLRGMVVGFLNAVRQMVAQAAAANLLDALFGTKGKSGTGGSGLADLIGGVIGGLFGGSSLSPVTPSVHRISSYAVGTNYVPRTGLAYLHQGEAVVPAHANHSAPTVINNNIDARGASVELIQALPTILQKNNEQLLDQLNRHPPARFR